MKEGDCKNYDMGSTTRVQNLLFQLKHNSINYNFQNHEKCFTSYFSNTTIQVFECGLFYTLISGEDQLVTHPQNQNWVSGKNTYRNCNALRLSEPEIIACFLILMSSVTAPNGVRTMVFTCYDFLMYCSTIL